MTADSTVNVIEDLSGISNRTSGNPYNLLIDACQNDPLQIQSRYRLHRETRNDQQRVRLSASDFPGVSVDPILQRSVNEPGFVDARNCLVFWARPPQHIRNLVASIQLKLKTLAPDLWLMPLQCLHMTVLEITHSLTVLEIETLVNQLMSKASEITDFPSRNRVRLIKPMLSYDGAAIALSFVPAAGEALPGGRTAEDDRYTYHHLRRDIYDLSTSTGVEIESRYTVPSSHLTIGRFISPEDFSEIQGSRSLPSAAKMKGWISKIEEMNKGLQDEFWPVHSQTIREGGEWLVGQEKGLDFRKGTLWYGGGDTVRLGQGF